MADAHDREILVNGLRLHFLEWGAPDRRPLLLLHGGSAHAHWWDFFAARLCDRYRLIALDLRGHGDSEWPVPRDYRLETHAADVRAVVAALDLRDVVVVGHSFGGFVAVVYARDAGPRLAALVVVDSRLRISERSARYMDALRKLPQPTYATPDEAVRRFRLLPSRSSARPDVLAHMVRHGITPTADGAWTLKFDRRALADTPPQDLAPALAAVRCPILVVRGDHSTIVSDAALDEFAAANPRVHAVALADAHHHLMLEQPEALAEAVERFLDEGRVTGNGQRAAGERKT